MTEHSASIFVFFFLAEYASIILICILNTILFFGGYISIFFYSIISLLDLSRDDTLFHFLIAIMSISPINLAVKTSILVFVFI
jgi:NADH-ubiquinone oxidoreductase chain 1